MFVVKEEKGKFYMLPSKEVGSIRFSPLAARILAFLARKPAYAKEIAEKLNVNEQKIYYHIRCLEKNGIIKVLKKEEIGGAIAKFYAVTKPSVFMRFSEFREASRIPKTCPFLSPFIEDGRLNARIVVGSPDPHGPEKARSRDINYAIDLSLFLGTFMTSFENPTTVLDTEIRESEMKDNLILIGGPVTNRVTRKINDRMPVRFDKKKNIFSSITKKTYKEDECGLVAKFTNPFDKNKKILVLAGKRYHGTKAAILALLKKFDELSKKDFHVVLGIDADYDGVIDDVKILE